MLTLLSNNLVSRIAFLVFAAIGNSSLAQSRFNATPLGSVDPGYFSLVRAINNNGDAVGFGASIAHPGWEAVLYSNGVATGLGTFGGALSDAIDINDSGVIVGYARNSSEVDQAFKFQAGVMTKLLPSSEGYSFALGINNLGAIVGQVGPGYPGGAAIFGNDTWQQINSAPRSAISINDKGQIVGDGAFLYDGASFSYPVFDSGLSYLVAGASKINSGGVAVGALLFEGYNNIRAYLFKDGLAIDISQGGRFGVGSSLNDIGQIVGVIKLDQLSDGHLFRAGLLQNGTLFNLNDLSDGLQEWVLVDATDINNKGQIVANGWSPALQRYQAFRLDPVAEVPIPATLALLGIGLIGVGVARRSRPHSDRLGLTVSEGVKG